MDDASVTIVVLSCDRPDWFRIALASAMDQTHTTAIIVADDSATDDVRLIAEQHPGRVEYLAGPRRGQLANLVNAVRFVRTAWTVVLHDDDVLEASCVEQLLGARGSGSESAIVIGDASHIDAGGGVLVEDLSSTTRRKTMLQPGENRLPFGEHCAALLVHGVVSPFLAALLPTTLLQGWAPDSRVGSVLDLSLCELFARQCQVIAYVPEALIRYRIHGASVSSSFADLEPLLFIIDGQLQDPLFVEIHSALRRRRADAIARQARVWTATRRWRDARDLLDARRSQLPLRYYFPSYVLTLPVARSWYGQRIRRSNPRLNAHRA